MGQAQVTPKTLLLNHFPEIHAMACNYGGVEVKKGKFSTLCSAEWPTFNVGWPPQGTFSLDVIKKGHPDQYPYILIWQTLAEKPPSWLKPFVPEKLEDPPRVLAVSRASHQPTAHPTARQKTPGDPSKKPVLQEESGLYPSLLDLDFERNPPPYAPVAHREETPEEEPSSSTSARAPILPVRGLGGTGPNGERSYQYWPFSSCDLYNWKAQNPPFSGDPRGLTDLIESVMNTHSPTWDDCQQLLKTLFTTEEQERILTEARKNVPGDNGRPTTLPNLIDESFPLNRPDWDFGNTEGRERLRVYRQTLMAGLRVAARRPTNLAKVKAVMQGENESLAVFLERFYDAYRQYTPLDPLAEENQSAVIMSFINQAAPDIRKKLYKQEGLGDMTVRDLVRVAERVFNTRETLEEREDRIRRETQELQERMRKEDREHLSKENRRQQKEMAKILLAGVQGTARERPGPTGPARSRKPWPRLERGQCAICRGHGHWKRDCPKRQGPIEQDAQVLLAGMDSD
uniref:Gag protein n=1 Tax=Moschus moschiferus TaxID=68415 RepID=A0A8C6CK95_MOSMO